MTTHVFRNRTPLLTSAAHFQILSASLEWCRRERGLKTFGFVFMPDHVHLLTNAEDPDVLQSTLVGFRRYCARQLLDLLHVESNKWAIDALRSDGDDMTLWRAGMHPVEAGGGLFDQKLHYIHMNPVRRGYVCEPHEWRFSSARNYWKQEPFAMEIDYLR